MPESVRRSPKSTRQPLPPPPFLLSPISLARKGTQFPKLTGRPPPLSPISTRTGSTNLSATHRTRRTSIDLQAAALPVISPPKPLHRRSNSEREIGKIRLEAKRPPRPSDVLAGKVTSRRLISMVSPKQKPELSTSSSEKGLGTSLILTDTDEKLQIANYISTYYSQKGHCPPTHAQMYTYKSILGSGASSKVWLAVHKLTNLPVAIKVFESDYLLDKAHYAQAEVDILRSISHYRVISLLEVFEDSVGLMNLVLEYASGGNLMQLMQDRGKLEESEAKLLFRDVVEGVVYIHRQGVLHRDLKLDNILLTEKSAQICDFGISVKMGKGVVIREKCGTPAFLAPEIIAGCGYEGFSSDIWSLGVCLYAMIVGMVPFRGYSVKEVEKMILKGRYVVPEEVSVEGKDLISKLLQGNPHIRMSAEAALHHPWLQLSVPRPVPSYPSLAALSSSMQAIGFPKDAIKSSSDFNHASVTLFLLSHSLQQLPV